MTTETISLRNRVAVLSHTSVSNQRQDQQRGSLKIKRGHDLPAVRLPKPNWICVKVPSSPSRFSEIKVIVRTNRLVTVCEEASCPSIGECWNKGTATFMIMGDKCTRRCRFCNVSTGRSGSGDSDEPERFAQTIALMKLSYVVITSVDRDDLPDGGASHFVACIRQIRAQAPNTRIEILTPNFAGRLDLALKILSTAPPDVLNHNIETVPRLYKEASPGADFQNSLNLLYDFKQTHPNILTKSGLIVGLGETDVEILQVMRGLRMHDVSMLTSGQYLQPSSGHMPVLRYMHPDSFKMYEEEAYKMGFVNVASGPMVRSSYHADQQAHRAGLINRF